VPALKGVLVVEAGRDYVFGAYKAPPPTFGDPPAKTIYLFVSQDANCEPFWSHNPCPWSDMDTVEHTQGER
jgi:hypothetical protein